MGQWGKRLKENWTSDLNVQQKVVKNTKMKQQKKDFKGTLIIVDELSTVLLFFIVYFNCFVMMMNGKFILCINTWSNIMNVSYNSHSLYHPCYTIFNTIKTPKDNISWYLIDAWSVFNDFHFVYIFRITIQL